MGKTGVWCVIIAFVFGIFGAVFTFVPPQTIRAIGLEFGRHDDRVLIGMLALIIAFVAVYKLLTLVLGKHPKAASKEPKKAKKSKKR